MATLFMKADTKVGSLAPNWYDKALSGAAMLLLATVLVALARGVAQWPQVPGIVWAHLVTVLVALVLTPWMLLRPRGTKTHRLLGKIWLGLMIIAALSSFFIHTIDLLLGFSPIHLLSAYVLYGSWAAIRAARAHRIREHRLNVIGMYIGGIVVAGGFTLLPGRLMHAVVFAWPTEWPDMDRLSSFFAVMVVFVMLLAALSVLSTRPWARSERR